MVLSPLTFQFLFSIMKKKKSTAYDRSLFFSFFQLELLPVFGALFYPLFFVLLSCCLFRR